MNLTETITMLNDKRSDGKRKITKVKIEVEMKEPLIRTLSNLQALSAVLTIIGEGSSEVETEYRKNPNWRLDDENTD